MYITYPMITMLKAVSTLSLEARFNILTSVMFKTDLQDKTELYFAKCYKEEFDKANKGRAKANARIITPGMIRMLKNEKLSILQRYNILVSVMFGSPIMSMALRLSFDGSGQDTDRSTEIASLRYVMARHRTGGARDERGKDRDAATVRRED